MHKMYTLFKIKRRRSSGPQSLPWERINCHKQLMYHFKGNLSKKLRFLLDIEKIFRFNNLMNDFPKMVKFSPILHELRKISDI